MHICQHVIIISNSDSRQTNITTGNIIREKTSKLKLKCALSKEDTFYYTYLLV